VASVIEFYLAWSVNIVPLKLTIVLLDACQKLSVMHNNLV